MALYALGDLHLSFQSDKSMDIFGSVWKRHERKIEKYVNRIVKPDDTLVLEYSCAGVPLFRRNGYRQSGGRKPLFRNRDTALT